MRSFPSLVLALCIAACSSAPTTDPAAKTPTGLDTTVFDKCVDFATKLCADAAGCCQTAYSGFDPDGCLDSFKRDVCHPADDAVRAGKATFDEDAVDACLAAHAQAHTVCIPTWQQTLELRKEIYAACRVVDGTTKPGGGCTTATTCKRPDSATATADCVKNVCQVIEVLNEGAECPFPSGSVSVCDDGLACDAPGLGTSGHCVKADCSRRNLRRKRARRHRLRPRQLLRSRHGQVRARPKSRRQRLRAKQRVRVFRLQPHRQRVRTQHQPWSRRTPAWARRPRRNVFVGRPSLERVQLPAPTAMRQLRR